MFKIVLKEGWKPRIIFLLDCKQKTTVVLHNSLPFSRTLNSIFQTDFSKPSSLESLEIASDVGWGGRGRDEEENHVTVRKLLYL